MSESFAFSVNAKPFVPKGFVKMKNREEILQDKIDSLQSEIDSEKLNNLKLMKLYKSQCSKVQGDSEERLKTLTSENERLNREIRQTNTRLLEEKCDKRDLEEKIQNMQAHINNLNTDLGYKDDQYNTLQCRFANLNREFDRYKERGDSEVWIGRCLKLDFIFKKMRQIGALSEDHGAWVWDMVDDIEFPGDQTDSIYLSLSGSIRNRYLPSFDDAGINFQSGEDSIINELTREAEEFNAQLSENFRRNLDENPELVMNGIRMIQSRFREHIRPNLEKRIKSAIMIQSVWRGFCGRGIITYKGKLDVNSSLTIFKLNLDREIPSTRQIIPEYLRDRPFRINFANTSEETIKYQWLNIDQNTLEGKIGREYSIKPGEIIMVKVYFGHWFEFKKESDTDDNFFRLMPFLGNLRRDEFGRGMCRKIVFDMNTKLTITKEHYDEWTRGVFGSHANRVLNTEHLSTERPEIIHENQLPTQLQSQEEDSDDDDARLMLAIQLSLEQTSSLTSDAIDFNIGDLFQ